MIFGLVSFQTKQVFARSKINIVVYEGHSETNAMPTISWQKGNSFPNYSSCICASNKNKYDLDQKCIKSSF